MLLPNVSSVREKLRKWNCRITCRCVMDLENFSAATANMERTR